jgi:hypothetical protein
MPIEEGSIVGVKGSWEYERLKAHMCTEGCGGVWMARGLDG